MSGSQIKKDIYATDKSERMVYNTINEHKRKLCKAIQYCCLRCSLADSILSAQ